MALPFQRLTIFEDDDVTPIVGTVDGSGNVTDPTCSTDPSHSRPYLLQTLELASQEVDLIEGHSDIGQLTVKVLDKRTDPNDQDTGWMTALLGGPSIGGLKFGQFIGHRALLEQADQATGTYYTVMNGILGDIGLDEDMVTYTLPIRDMRERERKTPAFNRVPGTISLYPVGLAMDYGRIGTSSDYMINAIGGVEAKVVRPVGAGYAYAWMVNHDVWSIDDAIGPEQASFIRSCSSTALPDPDDITVTRFTRLGVQWRALGSSDPWKLLMDMPVKDTTFGRPETVLFSDSVVRQYLYGEFYTAQCVYLATDDGSDLPAHDQSIELRLVYTGRPSETMPIYIECSFGQLLKDLYDGEYSQEDPRIKYDATAMASFVTNTPQARVKITESEGDLREWVEKNIYKPLGYAPGLNAKGEITPIKYALPDASVSLAQLDDTNIISGTWLHSYKDVVNKVIFKYVRESRPANSSTGPADKYFNILLEETEVEVIDIHPSVSFLGPQTVEIEADTIRTFTNFRAGAPHTGNVSDELGHQLLKLRSRELFDRFSYGAQRMSVSVLRNSEAVKNIKIGDWVTIACSWMPNYETSQRGINRIAQVISINDLDPSQREFILLDGGPNSVPLSAPTIGSLSLVGGRIRVPVSGIGVGTSVRVDYAVSAIVPDANSGNWIYAGNIDSDGNLDTPLVPDSAAGTGWIRARTEGTNRRPSAYLAPVSIAIPQAHRTFGVELEIRDGSNAIVKWNSNISGAGVRVHYAIFGKDSTPPTAFASYVDAAASAGQVTIPTAVRYSNRILVAIEPYSGWTGTAVSGTATDKVMIMGQRLSGVYIAPTVSVAKSFSGTNGTLTLSIIDPQYRVTKVEFRSKVGAAGVYSAWAEDAVAPYTSTVTVNNNDASYIEYRITAIDPSNNATIILQSEEIMASFQVTPVITIKQKDASTNSSAQYEVSATGAAELFMATGEDAFPGVSNLANPGTVTISRSANDVTDKFVRIKAVTPAGVEALATITVDFDVTPEVSVASDRTPIYSNNEQVGWRIRGTVDDDTRSIVLTLSGDLTRQSTSPTGQVSGAAYWIDTTSTKAWYIDLLQGAGQTGTATITPREFYNPAAGGLTGPAASVTLDRPCEVTYSIHEYDSKYRDVTFAARPSTAYVGYKIGAATQWTEVLGTANVYGIDVSAGAVSIQYYSRSASGVVSPVQTLTIDEDGEPEFLVGTPSLTEPTNNRLRATVGFDDDVVKWAMWARKGSSPVQSGEPIEMFKRYDGGVEKKDCELTASTGTWYVVIRIYDKTGRYTEWSSTKAITGSVVAAATLSSVRGQRVTHSGTNYHDLLWNHNSVAATGHKVRIRENGNIIVTLASNRSPITEHDGGADVALQGGYHVAKVFANQGDPGAEYQSFSYDVDLYTSADVLVESYPVVIDGYYLGDGSTGGSPPTGVPRAEGCGVGTSPTVTTIDVLGSAYVDWCNPDTTNPIRLRWYESDTSGGTYTLVDTVNLEPNTIFHLRYFQTGKWVKCTICYYNSAGEGSIATSNVSQVN